VHKSMSMNVKFRGDRGRFETKLASQNLALKARLQSTSTTMRYDLPNVHYVLSHALYQIPITRLECLFISLEKCFCTVFCEFFEFIFDCTCALAG
jgi:hypothetical protein